MRLTKAEAAEILEIEVSTNSKPGASLELRKRADRAGGTPDRQSCLSNDYSALQCLPVHGAHVDSSSRVFASCVLNAVRHRVAHEAPCRGAHSLLRNAHIIRWHARFIPEQLKRVHAGQITFC